MNLKKYIVNKRAIDGDELLQLIMESNGIYESTLEKLLQCNRISLEARLSTLEKHKWVSLKRSYLNTSIILRSSI